MRTVKTIFPLELYQKLTLAVCAVIILTTGIFHILGGGLEMYLLEMTLITAGYVAAVFFINLIKSESPRLIAQACLTVGIMFSLYFILATLTFEVMPYTSDPFLADIDEILGLGTPIVLWAERFVTPMVLNIFSFFYAVFIPYLYLSIFFSLFGRPHAEREVFILAFTITYSISFLGYLFVPAKGPVIHYAQDFLMPLDGGYFYQLILKSIDECGGPHGAFPSLHVGASWFICLFDLKYNRLRGLLYVPIVMMIVIATVILRYHYVIDLVAGLLIAVLAVTLAQKIESRKQEAA